MSSKDAIAQNIVMNKALYRLVPILDQIVDGLKQAGVLTMFQQFPNVCASLLMYNGMVNTGEVSLVVYVDEEETRMKPGDEVTLMFLHRYIKEATQQSMFDWE